MQQVYLGLGSNIDAEHNIHLGIAAIEELFGAVTYSSIYHSPAVGFDGAPFLNMVLGIKTAMSLGELAVTLRQLEYRYGRRMDAPKFTSRQLDIDILTFGDYCGEFDGEYGAIILPRPEVLENAYVLCPFAELVPQLILPGQTLVLKVLWQRYSDPQQTIAKVADVDRADLEFYRCSSAEDCHPSTNNTSTVVINCNPHLLKLNLAP